MPEHTTFFSYLLAMFREQLQDNAHVLGVSVIGHHEASWRSFEAILTSLLVMLVVIGLAAWTRSKLEDTDKAIVPDDTLTLRTFMEAFVGYFYDMTVDVMGAKRAKKFFPLIGASSLFIFFSNLLGLIPGLMPPTSSYNVTLGCALVVFILFNLYGIKENGLGYFKHMMGPKWYLAWLIFPIEVISLCVRPVTLSVRLMVNLAVDHLLASIFMTLMALFVPLPVMLLGVIVIVVQTLVFSLLTAVYIGLATEHEEHH